MRAMLLALCSVAVDAFVLTGVKPGLQTSARTAAPQALIAPDSALVSTLNMPMTLIADDSTAFVAVGGLLGFLFLFLVVGTVVTNFGIMKK